MDYFYPRSPCGERRFCPTCQWRRSVISIHALLAESDHHRLMYQNLGRHFYPRSPCGERPICQLQRRAGRYFYPRSPCGERQINGSVTTSDAEFLSTLSLRRATRPPGLLHSWRCYFYPRSPCGERRRGGVSCYLDNIDFYPRSPCGERHRPERDDDAGAYFYPRSPCGERQIPKMRKPGHPNFYPRSPCGERPGPIIIRVCYYTYFYPRSPCGERLCQIS